MSAPSAAAQACIRFSRTWPTARTVIPIGEPGHTDALEFADGKLMLGKYTREMGAVTWAR